MKILMSFLIMAALSCAADITGKWKFSVDLDNGSHGDPTFTLQQKGTAITGTYSGPMGEQTVTGVIKGDEAEFGFTADRCQFAPNRSPLFALNVSPV